jgi:uncharacterized membrane protein YozB (DUF420 family)
MDTSTNPSSPRLVYNHAHHYFILAMAITIFAFMPSYFTRLMKTDSAHHFHGITATLWMLLLIVQPLLYKRGLLSWHRNLGKVSLALVPLVVAGGLHMVQLMIQKKESYPPNIVYQLSFIDFTTLFLFVLFYSLALVYRRNIQLHARFMVCTVLGPLNPAITRLLFIFPFIDTFNKSLNIAYFLIELVILLLLLDDKRSGKIHQPYKLAMLFFVIQHILMNFVLYWSWWREMMDRFVLIM